MTHKAKEASPSTDLFNKLNGNASGACLTRAVMPCLLREVKP